MSAQFARAPHRGGSISTPQFPHAALLIDFDNVTMGIRSDLSKELKNLLSSDFIKGKVAVQRAYADWRRYPQYIVPLAESSVDLIFAPAYGSSKKNATDIRLAIDALELVFTRPEIGTFILLSGDSDFSSLVLKLKEYGKYVVGVGIRESASDLLVQNCDEYYSYSALTGLTRAGEESTTATEDPWELVELAIKQMAENNDVMRSDRLKQVILEMDPAFDEKALGFQKFNRFMQEAASRGLVSLRKLENGQFEVGLPGALEEAAQADNDAAQLQANGRRRGRRGRGRDRDRERPPEESNVPSAVAEAEIVAQRPAPTAPLPEVGAPAAAAPPEPAAAPAELPEAVVREEVVELAAAAPTLREPEARAEIASVRPASPADPLRSAYGLLRRAVSDVTGRSGEPARDSDIKRRMLELEAGWDEAALGFSKFSRFLRQAHDADVINLRKLENGGYEAALAAGAEPAAAEPAPVGRSRGRRERGRPARSAATPGASPAAPAAASAPESPREVPLPPAARASQVSVPPASSVAGAAHRGAAAAAEPPLVESPTRSAGGAPRAAAASAQPPAAPAAPRPGLGIGVRRGSRGRAPGAVPPPLLEGQTVPRALATASVPSPSAGAAPPAASAERQGTPATQVAVAEQEAAGDGKRRSRRSRTSREDAPARATPAVAAAGEKAAAAPARPAESQRPGSAAAPAAKRPAAGRKGGAAAQAAPAARDDGALPPDLESLGLPTDRDAVVTYLRDYEGVGPKSVQSLVDAFGAAGVFRALRDQPERVREVVGGTRGERLLEAWHRDYQRRVRAQAKKTAARAPRGRRGRGSKRTTARS